MKFIINTSFEPYFCALFDAQNQIVATERWSNGRKSGALIWEFLDQHQIRNQTLTDIGAVSGPGGFSHLRTGGVIMNALSFYFDLPIHQARADKVIAAFLKNQHETLPVFALNSFGSGFFLYEDGQLNRYVDIETAAPSSPVWTTLLPEVKQSEFTTGFTSSLEDIETSTLKTLLEQTATKTFVPDYEYPAVQP